MNFQPPDTPQRICPETGFDCDCNGECNMTNNQNWPDRVYICNEFKSDGHKFIGSGYYNVSDNREEYEDPQQEYVSAEKVREIQLATIRKTLDAVDNCAGVGREQSQIFKLIDPLSIIEQVGKV